MKRIQLVVVPTLVARPETYCGENGVPSDDRILDIVERTHEGAVVSCRALQRGVRTIVGLSDIKDTFCIGNDIALRIVLYPTPAIFRPANVQCTFR